MERPVLIWQPPVRTGWPTGLHLRLLSEGSLCWPTIGCTYVVKLTPIKPPNADTFLHCVAGEKTWATAKQKGETTVSSLQQHNTQPVRCRTSGKPEQLARDASSPSGRPRRCCKLDSHPGHQPGHHAPDEERGSGFGWVKASPQCTPHRNAAFVAA